MFRLVTAQIHPDAMEDLSSLSCGRNIRPIAMQIENSKVKWMKNMALVCNSSSICQVWSILSLLLLNWFLFFFSSLQIPHIVWVHVHVSENLVNVKKKDQKKKSPAFLFSPLCWIPKKQTKKNKEFRRKGLIFYAAMSVITFTTAAPFS